MSNRISAVSLAEPLGALVLPAEHVEELAPVGEAGQRVGHRLLLDHPVQAGILDRDPGLHGEP